MTSRTSICTLFQHCNMASSSLMDHYEVPEVPDVIEVDSNDPTYNILMELHRTNPEAPDLQVQMRIPSFPKMKVCALVDMLHNYNVDERHLVFMLTDMNLWGQGDNIMQQVSIDTELKDLEPNGSKRTVDYIQSDGVADNEVCFFFRVFALCSEYEPESGINLVPRRTEYMRSTNGSEPDSSDFGTSDVELVV